jgi:hypothetical protein
MTFQKKQANVSLGSEFGFQDNEARSLWALINDALKRGEEVTARVKAVNTTLDKESLVLIGEDDRQMPVFGVRGSTKMALGVELSIDVSVPGPEEQPETTEVPEGQAV